MFLHRKMNGILSTAVVVYNAELWLGEDYGGWPNCC